MKFNFIVKYAIRETMRRHNRSCFVILSYFLAVGSIMILISIIWNSNASSAQILGSTGTHFLIYVPSCSCEDDSKGEISCSNRIMDEGGEGFVVNGIPSMLIPNDCLAEIKKIPEVRDVAPFLLYKTYDSSLGSFTVGGIDLSSKEAVHNNSCSESDLVSGRFLDASKPNQVLLEEEYSRIMRLTTGENINIAGEKYLISGLVNTGVRPAKANIYMEYKETERAIKKRAILPLKNNKCNAILVEVKNATMQNKVINAVGRIIPNSVVSSYSCYKPAALVMGLNEKTGWLLIVVIGAGAIVLSGKSQAASLSERRKDIAIMKVIGWSKKSIASLLVMESVIQAILGWALALFLLFCLMSLPIDAFRALGSHRLLSISVTTMVSAFFWSR